MKDYNPQVRVFPCNSSILQSIWLHQLPQRSQGGVHSPEFGQAEARSLLRLVEDAQRSLGRSSQSPML